jgi:putative component of membrane protein insertase Oxa1/YidC/SpoIIIJ protein YidD
MESFAGKLFENIISFHTNIISPVDGPRSHFRPTSSRYMLLSMRKHGVIKGFLKGCDRLIRENSEKWVYRTIKIDGIEYKYDPT